MEMKTYTTIDREALGWPSGPWDDECDKMQWADEKTGLPCLAVRHLRFGNWCGYVGVAEGHPLFGKEDSDVEANVHGGLTFTNPCDSGSDESTGICHVPGPGEPDHVYWFGFDCAHAWDFSPFDLMNANERGYPYTIDADQEYRTLDYVKAECASLASQLIAAEKA